MKPAWLIAGRSINRFEHRWRIRNNVWGDETRPRMPRFRNHWMGRGEWWPMPRDIQRPKPGRLRQFIERDLQFF